MKFRNYQKPNFQIVESEPVLNKRLGIYYRPNTCDNTMINECMKNYAKIPLDENSIVLDLGANVGGFGKMALDKKVKKLICLEPDLFNFEVLEFNLNQHLSDDTEVQLFNSAVSSSDDSIGTFLIKDNHNAPCAGKLCENDKILSSQKSQEVNLINFDKLVADEQPTVIKIDIEGGEYDIMRKHTLLPDSVKFMSLELHGMNKIHYLKMVQLFKVLYKYYEIYFIEPEFLFFNFCRINAVFKKRKDVSSVNRDEFKFLDEYDKLSPRNIQLVKLDTDYFHAQSKTGNKKDLTYDEIASIVIKNADDNRVNL